MGPSVYAYKGVVYDRRGDADVRLTGEADKAEMAVRKQSYYTERRVYPWAGNSDLDLSLLKMLRDEVRASDAGHRWLRLDDEELLRDARLVGRDPVSGERGFNLATIMLLGREETILDVAPVYRTDCVLRRLDAERYDDRLTCTVNLMLAYDALCCADYGPSRLAAVRREGQDDRLGSLCVVVAGGRLPRRNAIKLSRYVA